MPRRPIPTSLACALAALLVIACGPADPPERKVRGVLTDVAAASITNLQHFDVRSADGQVVRFHVEGDVGMTPGHAREHMVRGEPVTVTFRDSGEGPTALLLED